MSATCVYEEGDYMTVIAAFLGVSIDRVDIIDVTQIKPADAIITLSTGTRFLTECLLDVNGNIFLKVTPVTELK